MAYINLAGGLKINTADAVDSRLVLTKAEMKSLHYANNESRPTTLRGKIFQLPSNYLCVCSEDNKIYVYNTSNEEDVLTGRFRKVESDGGKPILDISSYVNFDNNTITQEGFDLIAQKIINNEIVGVSFGAEGICMLLSDVKEAGFSFTGPYLEGHGRLKITFNGDLSVKTEVVNGSSGIQKVWYELPNLLLLENITQEQFNEIKNLALQNQLAGINCGGLYCSLEFYQEGENLGFFYPWYENGIFTAYLIRLDTDLSVKKIPYSLITLPSTSPSSQVIPSITTSNTQQNLTVGDGLAIENGALKTTSKVLEKSITDIITSQEKISTIFNAMSSEPTSRTHIAISLDNFIPLSEFQNCDKIILDLSSLSSLGVSGQLVFTKGFNTGSNGRAFYLTYMVGTVTRFSIANVVLATGSDGTALIRLVVEQSGTATPLIDTDLANYYTKTEVDNVIQTTIGDINSILDNINGEVI